MKESSFKSDTGGARGKDDIPNSAAHRTAPALALVPGHRRLSCSRRPRNWTHLRVP